MILVEHGTVVTVDRERRILRDGSVLIDGRDIVQVGPAPVLLPVLVWAWMTQPASTALILTVLLVPVALLDNVLKPILMARGLTTPMLVILTGVIGGTLTHGLIGLFLGPVVLSVFYELVVAWIRLGEPASAAAAPEPGPE